MPTSLQQEQQPIDEAIVQCVVANVPKDWTSAILTLERQKQAAGLGDFAHTLSSGDGHRPAMPDDSLFDATFRLDEVFRRYGAFLTRVTYRIEQRLDGQWKYVADYQHEKRAA